MISNTALMRIAGFGGIAVVATSTYMHFHFQKQLRETPSYKAALEIIRSHPKAIQYLGEPVKEGRIKVGEGTENIRSFTVLLKGTNTKGKVYCEVIPDKDPTKRSELKRIEITFDNIPDKIFTIFDKENMLQ